MQPASVGLRKDGLHCLDPPDVADSSETANANLFYFCLFFQILCFPPTVQKHAFKMYFFPPVNVIHPDIFMLDICALKSLVNIETIDSETPAVTFPLPLPRPSRPSNFRIHCRNLKHNL